MIKYNCNNTIITFLIVVFMKIVLNYGQVPIVSFQILIILEIWHHNCVDPILEFLSSMIY